MRPLDIITVYFSYNRPIQLDLALTTNQLYSVDWEQQEEIVLYKAENERYANAYMKVAKAHPSVVFKKEEDFKKDLLDILKDKEYIMFAVDDTIFTKPYSIYDICTMLSNFQDGIGFSLRLGKNTTYCYPLSVDNDMPEFFGIGNKDMLALDWTKIKTGDFGYPLEVSSSIFRASNIKILLENCGYSNPNELEYMFSLNLRLYSGRLPYILCYKESVAFSNPINKVKEGNMNRSGKNEKYTPESLLKKYERGYEIDYTELDGFVSNGCHQEVPIKFIRSLD